MVLGDHAGVPGGAGPVEIVDAGSDGSEQPRRDMRGQVFQRRQGRLGHAFFERGHHALEQGRQCGQRRQRGARQHRIGHGKRDLVHGSQRSVHRHVQLFDQGGGRDSIGPGPFQAARQRADGRQRHVGSGARKLLGQGGDAAVPALGQVAPHARHDATVGGCEFAQVALVDGAGAPDLDAAPQVDGARHAARYRERPRGRAGARLGAAPGQAPDQRDRQGNVERLGDEMVHAGTAGGILVRTECAGGQGHDRQLRKLRHAAQDARRLDAIHHRHLHVHQHQVGGVRVGQQPVDGNAAIFGQHDLRPFLGQDPLGHVAVDSAVVDHEEAHACQLLAGRLWCSRRVAGGAPALSFEDGIVERGGGHGCGQESIGQSPGRIAFENGGLEGAAEDDDDAGVRGGLGAHGAGSGQAAGARQLPVEDQHARRGAAA